MIELYGIPGSHSVMTAVLMLEHKSIAYRRIDLPVGKHWEVLPVRGFPDRTVPAMVIGGKRVQGTQPIARALDRLEPDPPLFPGGATRRRQIEQAEQLGEELLQPLAQRLVLAAAARELCSLVGCGEGGALGALLSPDLEARRMIMEAAGRHVFGLTPQREDADLAALPGLLDQIDAWIGEGVLGHAQPSAADFQIAPSIGLLMYRRDLRLAIGCRPAAAHAEAILRLGDRLPGEADGVSG